MIILRSEKLFKNICISILLGTIIHSSSFSVQSTLFQSSLTYCPNEGRNYSFPPSSPFSLHPQPPSWILHNLHSVLPPVEYANNKLKVFLIFFLTKVFSNVFCLLSGGEAEMRKIIFLICFLSFIIPLLIVIKTISIGCNIK